MIQTVNSQKLDVNGASSLFKKSNSSSLDKRIDNYKREVRKNGPIYIINEPINSIKHANNVLQLICEELELSVEVVKSKIRLRTIVEARQIYSFIIMKVSTVTITLTDAGKVIDKDHATILHGIKQAIDLNETDIPFSKKLDKCITAFTKRFSGAEFYIMDFNNIPQF